MKHYTVLESIAIGNPPLKRTQRQAAAFMEKVESLPIGIRKRIPRIYARSGIECRYTCIDDYGRDAACFDFYPPNWRLEPFPSTADRNRHYKRVAPGLADRVAREALTQAAVPGVLVSHLIVVSCTGLFAPGLDVHLVKSLGLRPGTARTVVGFMGCFAAFNAMRLAHSICKSDSRASVLVVCVELCTLHFQVSDSLESAIVNSLFSDGAAAAVFRSRSPGENQRRWAYVDNETFLAEQSLDDMTWDIGDSGFLMGLSTKVPKRIASHIPPMIERFLSRNRLQEFDIDFWAFHPGGRKIVEYAQKALGLADEQLEDSVDILRRYGNMSSPTIFFILERILRAKSASQMAAGSVGPGVAMAFGPGLTIETCLFRPVGTS